MQTFVVDVYSRGSKERVKWHADVYAAAGDTIGKKSQEKKKKNPDMSSKLGVSWIMQETSPVLREVHIIL